MIQAPTFVSVVPDLLTFTQLAPATRIAARPRRLCLLTTMQYAYSCKQPTTKDTPMTETTTSVVTDAQAEMLAAHAIHVQGGYSTPQIERERAEAQIAALGSDSIDWDKMEGEVIAALAAKSTPAAPASAADETEPAEAPASQYVDVTAVLASIDQGAALRDRIKAMQAELKIHEDNIKDAMGAAVTGTDATGKIVVRYPFRNRSGLVKEKVKEFLSDEDFAKCTTETSYRTLLYGEG